jgi:hypothetical protein
MDGKPEEMTMVSIKTLEKRYERVLKMQRNDKARFKPNSRGDGYLTRNERYQELLWQIEPILRKECGLSI